MAGEPILAHGTIIAIGDGATPVEAFTTIANRTDISLKPPAKEKVDVTHHDSTAREYIKGFGDGGEVTFSIFYHPSNAVHLTLRDAHDEETTTNFQITLKDTTVIAFAAYVMLQNFDFGVANKAQTCSVKLEISGDVTYTDPV